MGAIEVREVWASNVAVEMSKIEASLHQFHYISIDTEFPGTVFTPNNLHQYLSDPSEFYALMKRNVDALCLIQLGLTLFDGAGNIGGVWQFNFSDFDADSQPHNKDSISLLRRQGIDFSNNRTMGIRCRRFASLFKKLGLHRRNLTWITFHGASDLGYLIKMLANRNLPDHIGGFMALLHHYLGPSVYDIKPMAGAFGLHGGLDKIATRLAVERAAGRSHQAGSDSLLTAQVLKGLIRRLGHSSCLIKFFNYNLFGLSITPAIVSSSLSLITS